MIHLRLRTEYSFRTVFGRIESVLARVPNGDAVGIADTGTWGHVPFYKAARATGRKPLLGAEIALVPEVPRAAFAVNGKKPKQEKLGTVAAAFLARNAAGLEELYRLVSLANTRPRYYYVPRLDYRDVNAATKSGNLIFLSGANADLTRLTNRPNVYLEMNPGAVLWNRKVRAATGWSRVICCDNRYPTVADRVCWEILSGLGPGGRKGSARTTPQHILDEDELRLAVPEADDEAFRNTERIAAACDVTLPKAAMVRFPDAVTLEHLCYEGAQERGMATVGDMATGYRLDDHVYDQRLWLELELIHKKNFEDYFYVIGDLVREAKRHMLVGPARGSSAGSLVCFLLGITDVDPIKHDLMFERFIDITRADLPDIDLDFQDDRREMVGQYLANKYGAERVGRLGTVLLYKAKSALGDVAKTVGIPAFEIADLKGAIIERSSGDARAQFCIDDTFQSLDIGKKLLAKYPLLTLAGQLEGHAQYSGTHAAGIVVTEEALTKYAALDAAGALQIDKKSAEALNILKIDALGLRTLTVLQDILQQIGKDRNWLINYPLDDSAAFDIFNADRFTGIFQYEGYALQTLCKQMKVRNFDDVAVITALARPGPLHCGAAEEFIQRRTGRAPVVYLHAVAEPFTRSTYGTVIYQEQVMMICRHVGQLSWDDVQTIRRAMSKSLGDEFFGTYWERFREGAGNLGIPEPEARAIWDKICTFGSWAFNKSHAYSYGLLSYWCAMLKARYPLEFAAACLRAAKDEEQSVKLLREMSEEGLTFTAVDPGRSGETWEVRDGELLGGLTNIKGLGPAKARTILAARAKGEQLTPGLAKLLDHPVTPYDDLFTGRRRFAALLENPRTYQVTSGKITPVRDITEPGEYVFIARIREKNQRDLNEQHSLNARGGRRISRNNLFLNLVLEDDTGLCFATVGRYQYAKYGVPIIERGKVGDWYLWKGEIQGHWEAGEWKHANSRVYISKCRSLEDGSWPL
jgi:DNA polymerase III alpha subunit